MNHINGPRVLPRRVFRGFTLIEILVVVAIIALLAAILFPVFSRARESSRRATCQSNLKQIGLALAQYASDYDGRYCNGYVIYNSASAACVPQKNWYVLQVGFDGGTNGLSTTWMDYVEPYAKSTQLYYCPSGPPGNESNWGNGGALGNDPTMKFGYAVNNWVLAPLVYNPTASCTIRIDIWSNPVTDSVLQNPASVVVLADRGQWQVEHLQQFSTSAGYAEQDPDTARGQQNGTNPSWRHNGTSNFLYADGHVKALNAAKISTADYGKMLGCGMVSNPANCL